MSELNLKNAISSLIAKALNKYRYKYEAAEKLGVNPEKVGRLAKQYNLILINGTWIKKENQQNEK